MEVVVCSVPFGRAEEEDALRLVRDLGFTSVQVYTFWKDFEPARGEFDWSGCDRTVDLIRAAGLRYVPFILMGPKYASPGWWLNDPRHTGLVCLEHAKESPVESVWNPAFRDEVPRVLEVFAEHYLPLDVLESVQPGVSGDYGEAIFPVLGNWPGDYHTHPGFWCGGEDALRAFRAWLRTRHTTVDGLNAAWRSRYADFDDVCPLPRHRAPSRRAFLEMVEWYRSSMTDYADFWMSECRRCFPETPVYLCTGGSEEPEHGSLFADQAKVAARHGGGIRLTNEGNSFYSNFRDTAHMAAACRFYGAYLGLEPVGPMTERGVAARCFGSLAYGNRQIFHYYGNVVGKDGRAKPGAEAPLSRYRDLFGTKPGPEGIALFWPEDRAVIEGGMPPALAETLEALRRSYRVDPVSETMILDGALGGVRSIVMVHARCARREVLEELARWVREEGGTALSAGRVLDIELDPVAEFDAIFGIMPDSEEAWGHARQEVRRVAGFDAFASMPPFDSEAAWIGLSPDAEILSASRPRPGKSGTAVHEAAAAFRRDFPGGGQAVFYSGRVSLRDDPEAVFHDPGCFMALLEDVCVAAGQARAGPAHGETARAVMQGGTLVLGQDGIDWVPATPREGRGGAKDGAAVGAGERDAVSALPPRAAGPAGAGERT